MKSRNISSATGRSPEQAAPTAAPMNADHAVHVAALGDGVAVAAVGGGDVVVGSQVGADAGDDGLLTRIQVDEPGDLAGGELLMHPAGR
jgi:hypothetical protein